MVIGYGSDMPFLTFITYRLPWHLIENIWASVPRVRLIVMCHKMVKFLSTYRLLSRLAFTNDPSFLWKNIFKSKTNILSKETNIMVKQNTGKKSLS